MMETAQRSLEPYVDAAAAAQFLGMHPKTLERLAKKGTAPGHPIGEGNQRKRWRFLISELDTWLRARRAQPR
jgi:predicted DNA-binding transcriptional regulator AlpA